MRAFVIATLFGLSLFMAACAAPSQGATTATRSGPFIAPDLPALAGQLATCAGPRRKTFDLEAREVTLDLGMGMQFNAWTYDGTLPGPESRSARATRSLSRSRTTRAPRMDSIRTHCGST